MHILSLFRCRLQDTATCTKENDNGPCAQGGLGRELFLSLLLFDCFSQSLTILSIIIQLQSCIINSSKCITATVHFCAILCDV